MAIQLNALFLVLFVFLTSCGGPNKTESVKENIKSETRNIVSSTGRSEKYHTKYVYTDPNGKSLIIENSLPRAELYTDPDGNEYAKAIFWTRIINETDTPLEWTIDFPGDPYEFPGSVGSSMGIYYKLILPSDTMTSEKEDLFNYGLTDLDTLIVNSFHKPSSLRRTIDPKKSSGFYVVRLGIKPKSGWPDVKADGKIHLNPEYGTTRAGFSLKGQNLFYTLNGKEIHCGKINLKNLKFKNRFLKSY